MIFNMNSGRMKTPVLSGSAPADVTVNAGADAVFRVEIAEDGLPGTYTYQWYVNGGAVSGATGASYTRNTAADMGVYSVHCVVTNRAGAVTSRTATLTVRKTPVPDPGCPADAVGVKYCALTCQAVIAQDGYPASYTYQWYKNGAAVAGATGPTWVYTPTTTGPRTVSCTVTNAAGTVTTRTATITVTDLYLYNAGDENTSVTGGWSPLACKASGEPGERMAPTVTRNAASMTVQFNGREYDAAEDGTDVLYAGCVMTEKAVDLTNYQTLKINVTDMGYYISLRVADARTDGYTNVSYLDLSGSGEQSLDVSALSGAYYIAIASYGFNYSITFASISLS